MVALIKHRLLFTTLLASSVLSAWQSASAVEPTDVEADLSSLTGVAKSTIQPDFVESLRAGPAKFQDYQCFCRLYAKRSGKWKDMGGAQFAYKFRNLFRAVIKTSDYRNGSVVVRNPEGEIRGSGGGTLRFVKMTLQADSRTLQLPTGYSLAKSDFLSLYDSIKASLSSGATGHASTAAVNSKLFGEPVTVLVIKKGGTSDSSISEVIVVNPKTKLPTLWMTFKAGQPDAIVFFEDVQPNKGLNDTMFSL